MFHSGLLLYLREKFHSLPILIPILFFYCQFSLFCILDKGVTGFFTGILYLGVDGLCLIGEKDIDFGVVGLCIL